MEDMTKFCTAFCNQFSHISYSGKMDIGKIIYIFRVKSLLTQEDLASRANLCTQTIKRIERGKGGVTDITCKKILDALGINIVALTKLLD
ncbi:helix-turn-helix domain-containing protein [Rossellomorea aquimaris]|uniref:helix-turn-helix domain-containing protein n=1 Tax=Rossellomorea aquimaris TaxID=189382 RepID=UPI0007D05FC7|nr:helix-turn-helix transcriptional regulator [Rossellomorea aquimaris]